MYGLTNSVSINSVLRATDDQLNLPAREEGRGVVTNLEVAVVSIWRRVLNALMAMEFTGFATVSLHFLSVC